MDHVHYAFASQYTIPIVLKLFYTLPVMLECARTARIPPGIHLKFGWILVWLESMWIQVNLVGMIPSPSEIWVGSYCHVIPTKFLPFLPFCYDLNRITPTKRSPAFSMYSLMTPTFLYLPLPSTTFPKSLRTTPHYSTHSAMIITSLPDLGINIFLLV